MKELKEYREYIIMIYDNYLMKTENRGISYREIVHIENLNRRKLEQLEKEIWEELKND